MKIENKTRWSTEDLRALISACLKARGVPSKGLSVTVVACRGARISGYANIGRMRQVADSSVPGPAKLVKRMRYGTYMTLRLPNPIGVGEVRLPEGAEPVAPTSDLRERFARVVEHEVAHLQGLDHKAMGEKLYYCNQEMPWLGDLPLRAAEVEAAPDKIAAFADKEAHARRMLAKAITRERRAITGRKKWERRVNYYGKKAGTS